MQVYPSAGRAAIGPAQASVRDPRGDRENCRDQARDVLDGNALET